MADSVAALQPLLEAISRRLGTIESKLGIAGAELEGEELPGYVAEYEALLNKYCQKLEETASAVHAEVSRMTGFYVDVLKTSLAFMIMAAKSKKAPQSKAVAKFSDAIKTPSKSMQTFRCAAEFDNHWKALREAFNAASWVVMEPPALPKDTTTAAKESAEFWLNKVRAAHRESETHKAWCEAIVGGISEMTAFIRSNCNTGISWKPSGGDIDSYDLLTPASTDKAPAETSSTKGSSATPAPAVAAEASRGALFASIQGIDQSSGRTAGLKHVTKDMKSKGSSATVPAKHASASSASTEAPTKPKNIAKVGMRWIVENCGAADGVVTLDEVSLKEEVYIGGCVGATIVITSRCKTLAIDKCSKCNVVFESALTACEVVNCKRLKIQCKKFTPTFGIDKTDGIVVYVSYEGRASKFLTSKSSEMNVSFPTSDAEDADTVELPIPEQFVASIEPDNKVTMAVSEIYSS